jgi:hypothetical protein
VRPATPLICQFIAEHREEFGVAPVCRALTELGVPIAPRTYWGWLSRAPSRRALWDAAITEILAGVYEPDQHGRRPPVDAGQRLAWGHPRPHGAHHRR